MLDSIYDLLNFFTAGLCSLINFTLTITLYIRNDYQYIIFGSFTIIYIIALLYLYFIIFLDEKDIL